MHLKPRQSEAFYLYQKAVKRIFFCIFAVNIKPKKKIYGQR